MSLSAALAQATIAVLSAAGYPGLVLLMAAESACLPLPSEVILPFAGYLVSRDEMNLWLVATFGALGCNLGSAISYEIGRYGGRPALERWGRYLLVTRHDLELADRFFGRFGDVTVLIARLLPVVRTYIALPAGIARMPRLRFQLYTFIGSWPWCFGLAAFGMLLGRRWRSVPWLDRVFHGLDIAIALCVVIALARFIWMRRARRRG